MAYRISIDDPKEVMHEEIIMQEALDCMEYFVKVSGLNHEPMEVYDQMYKEALGLFVMWNMRITE